MIPEDESVRLLSHELEELDYTLLYQAYSAKGRNPAVDPKTMLKILTYACSQNRCGCHIYNMKADHMRNAQLKPGYNVQIGEDCMYQNTS